MKTFAVIGLGQLGAAVAQYLCANGAEVIAIDRNLERVEALKDVVARALCLDSTNEKALREAGVVECGCVILALGEGQLEEAVLTTVLLRQLGVGQIVSRAATDVQARVLETLGVSRVVFPERQIGVQLARQLLLPAVHELVPLTEGTSMAEVSVPERFWGKSLAEIQLRRAFGVNVVALKTPLESAGDDGVIELQWDIDSMPGPDSRLGKGDILVIVGPDDGIRRFLEISS